MFTTREYDWSKVTVVLAGRMVTGVRGVEYTESLEKEALYAKGNKPIGIQHGNKSYSGKIKVLQSELQAMKDAAKITGNDLLELQFNIIVAYGNPLKGDLVRTDVISGAEFTEVPKSINQGDKMMEIELPFIFLDIKNI